MPPMTARELIPPGFPTGGGRYSTVGVGVVDDNSTPGGA
jgi:hypothetical protein